MFTLATAMAALTWVATHLWALALLAVPAILGFIKPLLDGLVDGLKAYLSTLWDGMKSMDFKEWLVVLTLALVVGGVGYKLGWDAAIAWGHEHFRWIAKKAVSSWWLWKW